MPSTSSAIAVGWSPFGSYSDLMTNCWPPSDFSGAGGGWEGAGGGGLRSNSVQERERERADRPAPPPPSPPRASRAGGGEKEASSRFATASRFATSSLVPRFAPASRFATSSLVPRVEARARCTAASPPERRAFELSGGGPHPEFFSASPCALFLPPPLRGGVSRGG